VLGFAEVKALVLATSVVRIFRGARKTSEVTLNPEYLWRHSLATGIAAREIAATVGMEAQEDLFTAGLLHDIGKLIMVLFMQKELWTVVRTAREQRIPMTQAEIQKLGFTHADVGRVLLQRWQLPPRLQECVASHHAPEESSNYARDVAVVHLADIVVHALGVGEKEAHDRWVIAPVHRDAWALVGLQNTDVEKVMERIIEKYEKAQASMDMV